MSSKRAHNGRDLTGQRFERLTVVSRAESKNFRSRWNCVCSCGAEKTVTLSDLVTGHAKSCGCLHAEVRRSKMLKHGFNRTPTYITWTNMLARCDNEKNTRYSSYGGRGITVCERWREFSNFLVDMGVKPEGMTIDRVDVNGNYDPSNCRWATQEVQNNNKRGTVYVTLDGKRLSVSMAAKVLGASVERVRWAVRSRGEDWLEYVRAAAALAPTP